MSSPPTDELAGIDFARPDQPLPARIGPFRITGRIGSGGMGVVLDAIMETGEAVALKLIRPRGDLEYRQMLTARLLREAKILTQLSHPGIVRLHAYGHLGGLMYLAMERVEGVTLQDIRARTSVELGALLSLGKQLSSTLAALHAAGVVHRDIKPENVLIDRSGRTILTDFGIAWVHEGTGITNHGQVLGSAGYLAPECLEGQSSSPLSDQYALGKLLFEVAALRPAKKVARGLPLLLQFALKKEIDWTRFPSEPPWPVVERIIRRMTATDPHDRFPDAQACCDAIVEFEGIYRAEIIADENDPYAVDAIRSAVAKKKVPTSHAGLANPTVFVPANTLNRFIDGLKISPHSPWEPRTSIAFEEETPPPSRPGKNPTEPGRDRARVAPTIPAVLPGTGRAEHAEEDPVSRVVDPASRSNASIDSSPTPPVARTWSWGVVLFGIFIGALATESLVRFEILPARLAGVLSPDRARPSLRFRFHANQPPNAKQVSVATGMLHAAEDELEGGAFERAEQLLGDCIVLSDLAECHRKLAALLFLAGDRAAEAHAGRSGTPAPLHAP